MKGYKHLSEELRRRVLELHRRPMATPAIAAELGVGIRQVQHTIRRAGLTLSGSRDGACYRDPDLVRRLAAEGLSFSEMGRRLGTNKGLVKAFLLKHGIPHEPFRQSGPNNPSWKGGRQVDKSGYVLVHQPAHPEADRHGYVREHRLVMEQTLGRQLLPTEVVHHKDDNRANNNPSNLELFASNGDHLSATRTGKIPEWSEEGRARVIEACRRGRESPRRSSRRA